MVDNFKGTVSTVTGIHIVFHLSNPFVRTQFRISFNILIL